MADCITLQDPNAGTSARICTEVGFNCFSFTVPLRDKLCDVLWAAEGFAQGAERPSGSGIPLLFPFPGRLTGQVFHWEGQSYAIPAGDGRGNAIHGFALDRPWRVTHRDKASVTGEFQASREDPSLLARWPSDFRLVATYQLNGCTLQATLVAENPDATPLPCGMGAHPYFRLPLGGTSQDACSIRLPVGREWQLVDMIPTGARTDIAGGAAYREGIVFGDMQLDNVFTDLQFKGDWCTSQIADPESGVRVELSFDKTFRECVVYTPPHREAICIEPYTCLPGAATLDRSVADTGWRVLEPGASLTARFQIQVVMPGSTRASYS